MNDQKKNRLFFNIPAAHTIPEIRLRALENIEAKVLGVRNSNLNDVAVDPYNLIKHLLLWFRHQPVTHEERVLQLIIAALSVSRMRNVKRIDQVMIKRISLSE